MQINNETSQAPRTDVRMGLPSASGMERLINCPGSYLAEQSAPPSEDSPWSAEGTLLHAVLAYERPYADLTEEQQQLVDRIRAIEDMLVVKLGFDAPGTAVLREQREWYRDSLGKRLWSGQADVIRLDTRKRALVIDYKTGRGDVESAEGNYQMRALAVLTAEHNEVDEVLVAIVQPFATSDPVVVRYTTAHLDQAETETLVAIERSKDPEAPRVAGDHCKYCRALAGCPAAQQSVTDLATEAFAWTKEALPTFTGEQLAELLPKVKLAKRVCDAVEERAKAFIDAGNEIPGWYLKPGAVRREISDASAAFELLSDILDQSAFVACCSVAVGKLETAVKASTGSKATEAKELVNGRLAEVIVEKRNAPSLATSKNQLAEAAR